MSNKTTQDAQFVRGDMIMIELPIRYDESRDNLIAALKKFGVPAKKIEFHGSRNILVAAEHAERFAEFADGCVNGDEEFSEKYHECTGEFLSHVYDDQRNAFVYFDPEQTALFVSTIRDLDANLQPYDTTDA
jgi:hypothetical protein